MRSAYSPEQRPEERREEKGRETEKVESGVSTEFIWELRVSPKFAGEDEISRELKVWSKSSIRPDESVNCAWSDYDNS